MIESDGIEQAAKRISPYVLKTPLERAPIISDLANCDVLLKMEQLQPTGSFKIRGATNKLLTLPRETLDEGVVAASTGNHGAAMARAARLLSARAIVYVPKTAEPLKLKAIQEQGAEIRFAGTDGVEAEIEARAFALDQDLEYISPYNDEMIVMGQGTIGLELSQQIPELDTIYISVGGGGLISGVATYLKSFNARIQVIACSPENSSVMHHSIEAGRILELASKPTLSDGTAGGIESGTLTFEICRRVVDRWLLVPENAIADALRLAIQQLHLRIEGSAALALAGLIQDRENISGKNVAAIMCGGNISDEVLQPILS